jgi:hypothetical protein
MPKNTIANASYCDQPFPKTLASFGRNTMPTLRLLRQFYRDSMHILTTTQLDRRPIRTSGLIEEARRAGQQDLAHDSSTTTRGTTTRGTATMPGWLGQGVQTKKSRRQIGTASSASTVEPIPKIHQTASRHRTDSRPRSIQRFRLFSWGTARRNGRHRWPHGHTRTTVHLRAEKFCECAHTANDPFMHNFIRSKHAPTG